MPLTDADIIINYLAPLAFTMLFCSLVALRQFREEMMEQGRWF
tara:strand:+ start:3338 stop:3466 length:129 start_codon:yes stop_codon:yes gene_type:complete